MCRARGVDLPLVWRCALKVPGHDWRVTFFPPDRGEAFVAYHRAVAWCRRHGFAEGSMQRGSPTALVCACKVEGAVPKWRNIPTRETDGRLVTSANSWRHASVQVWIRPEAWSCTCGVRDTEPTKEDPDGR